MKFQHLGRISIPKELSRKFADLKKAKLNRRLSRINPDYILQGPDLDWCCTKEDHQTIAKLANFPDYSAYEKSHALDLLMFKSVTKHKDDGYPWTGRNFLQVVLFGKFTLHFNGESTELKKGDIFVMNPQAQHWVIAKNPCATMVLAVPAKDYLRKKL